MESSGKIKEIIEESALEKVCGGSTEQPGTSDEPEPHDPSGAAGRTLNYCRSCKGRLRLVQTLWTHYYQCSVCGKKI